MSNPQTPTPASPAYYHPTRKWARPLRTGDRVRDIYADPNAQGNSNYPGAHAFGTVISEAGFHDGARFVCVRYDDGIEARLPAAHFDRL